MTKKIISVLLALMMAFSLSIPSFAASEENQKLTKNEISESVKVAVAALLNADDDATVVVDNALIKDILAGADTPAEIAASLSGLIFVEKDLAEQISTDIVENSKYTVKVIEDGKTTVYCSIDLETFSDIYDARVFLLAIGKIQKKCDEVALKNNIDISSDSYSPMSYSHIAGELAIHMILNKLSRGSASWNPIAEWIYERANIADLNVDEDRFPSFLTTSFGDFIVALFNSLLKVF